MRNCIGTKRVEYLKKAEVASIYSADQVNLQSRVVYGRQLEGPASALKEDID